VSIVGSYHATRVARPLHRTEDIRLSSAVLLKLSGALKAVEVPEVRAAARLPRGHALQVSPSTNLSMHVACSTSLKRYHSPASGARRHACSSACSSCSPGATHLNTSMACCLQVLQSCCSLEKWCNQLQQGLSSAPAAWQTVKQNTLERGRWAA